MVDSWDLGKMSQDELLLLTYNKTRVNVQRVTNTHGWHHFLIIKYFKVNDNDIRQDIVYIVTDLSFKEQLSWSKQSLRYEANLQGHKI